MAADPLDPAEVIDLLRERQGFLEGVVLSGGEPTLQADLPRYCRELKDLGYAVKLDTNGSRPQMLRTLLSGRLVDYIAMDIKTHPDRYTPLVWFRPDAAALRESIALILTAGIPHEFRTTCMGPLVDSSLIGQIARLIDGADLYALQQVRTGEVLDPDFCRNSGRAYGPEELALFRSLAAAHVKRCIVR